MYPFGTSLVGLWTGDRLGPPPLWSARRSLPRGSRSRRSAVYTGSSPVGFPERLRANAELATLDLSSVRRWRRSPISTCCPTFAERETALLREVEPQDISVFFEQQDDPVASAMAAFPSRDRAAHDAHWAKILADNSVIARTIVEDGQVVGNIGSWVADGQRGVGYWIGRQHWGRGYATRALADLVAEVPERPLHARVAEHNVASIRVLAKCGFSIVGEEQHDGAPVKEIVMRLDA
jgi:RimJ/RimL family protein N-acetyltransferase